MKKIPLRLGDIQLGILSLLATEKKRYMGCEMADILKINTLCNVYSRLKLLRDAGLVEYDRNKRYGITSLGRLELIKRIL